MKLRIKGDSIRLRLSKSEVARIARGESVRESTSFSEVSRLEYVLEPVESGELQAGFDRGLIHVGIPRQAAIDWAHSSTVSLKAEQRLPASASLRILIEKDFTCLKPRQHESEDESDLFPNPNEAHGSCGGP